MIRTNVIDIVKRGEQYIVLLQDEAKEKLLPIWVGPQEGTAIALGLRAFPTQRPLTFDFIERLLIALDAQLEEARVEALKDTIFYGIAKIRLGNNEIREVDARPSDVLALAVRTGSPIFVSKAVMQQAGQDLAEFESNSGPYSPGEGVEKILNDFEKKMKQSLTHLSSKPDEESRTDDAGA